MILIHTAGSAKCATLSFSSSNLLRHVGLSLHPWRLQDFTVYTHMLKTIPYGPAATYPGPNLRTCPTSRPTSDRAVVKSHERRRKATNLRGPKDLLFQRLSAVCGQYIANVASIRPCLAMYIGVCSIQASEHRPTVLPSYQYSIMSPLPKPARSSFETPIGTLGSASTAVSAMNPCPGPESEIGRAHDHAPPVRPQCHIRAQKRLACRYFRMCGASCRCRYGFESVREAIKVVTETATIMPAAISLYPLSAASCHPHECLRPDAEGACPASETHPW